MTEKELSAAQVAYVKAQVKADDLRFHRDALVQQALQAGWTHARISEATGLTRGRIGQMAQKGHRFR